MAGRRPQAPAIPQAQPPFKTGLPVKNFLRCVYDGMDLWEEAPSLAAELNCPACAKPLSVALVDVLRAPTFTSLGQAPWILALIQEFALRRHGSGPFEAIVDETGLLAHLLRHDCPHCQAPIASAWGHGEFQPARYMANFSGAAIADLGRGAAEPGPQQTACP